MAGKHATLLVNTTWLVNTLRLVNTLHVWWTHYMAAEHATWLVNKSNSW